MRKNIYLIIIIVSGIMLRLYLAHGTYNNDIKNILDLVEIFRSGKPLYVDFPAYNYTPIFFYISGILYKIQQLQLINVSFPFFYRSFLTLIDILTLFVVLGIARKRKLSINKTAILFFLNPVSITISGHHGQFDNISILFLLLVLYLHESSIKIRPAVKTILLWFLLTTGFVIKHIILFHIFGFWRKRMKSLKKALFFSGITIFIFLLTFLPYVNAHGQQIQKQVFGYGGLQDFYGISYFLRQFCGQCELPWGISLFKIISYIFVVISIIFVLTIKHRDIVRMSLIIFLYFLTFTTGIGAQYHVWPIALGALFPTKWFYLYSFSTTLFFLGNIDEYNIPAFQTFSWNMVWIFTTLWFFSELLRMSPRLRKIMSGKRA